MLTTIARGRVFNFSHAVGRTGRAPYAFDFPNSVAIGRDGVAYVLCRSQKSVFRPYVSRIAIGDGPGEEEQLEVIGGPGEGDGEFIWPSCVALDSNENVYVSDEYLLRVSVFDKLGKFLYKWNTLGEDPSVAVRPSGMVFDSDDTIYLVDAFNHRIQHYSNDGNFLDQWGTHGHNDGELDHPWGITLDANGCVYVADWKNHRVQKFTKDGKFISQFGRPTPMAGNLGYPDPESYPHQEVMSHLRRPGHGTGELNHPSDVAVDGSGDVYVVDWGNECVQVYASDGEFIVSSFW